MNSTLNILIPQKIESISRYVLEILEDRWDVRFSVQTHPLTQYFFSLDGKPSVSFPALFIESEQNKWLHIRSELDFPFRDISFNSDDKSVPVLALTSDPNTCDPIGTLFLFFSRYEEYVLTGEDHHDSLNRFLPDSSLSSDYLNRPIADEIIEQFRIFLNAQLECSIKPKNSDFQILPSHDVDRPFEFLYYSFSHLIKRIGGDLLLRKSPRDAVQRLKSVRKVKSGHLTSDPNNTFDWIMSASEQSGRVSTFHFLADVTNPSFDHDYELNNPEILQLLQEISARGHAVGLHPSFKSSEIPGQISKEAEILRTHLPDGLSSKHPLKSRYHYLRWNTNSVTELEKAQVEVDQTLGFAQKPGFRCGTSLPFPAFNFDKMRTSSLSIEPLILMEQSLISPVYMNMRHNLPDAWNIVSDLKEKCRKHGGNFTILWHNDHLKDDDLKDFYLNCIS